jgi:hypothetical protein
VGGVAVVLLAAMFWRAPRPLAGVALAIAFGYIGARIAIHAVTAREVHEVLVRRGMPPSRLMVAPLPLDPLAWDVVAQTDDVYRYGRYRWIGRTLRLEEPSLPVPKETPEWRAARNDPSVRGFMSWARFPWYEIERDASGTRVLIHDARYAVRRRPGGGFGGVVVDLDR